MVAPSEEVFWAKATSWNEAQHHAFHVGIVHEVASRASHVSHHVSKVTSFWISFSSVDFGVWSTYEIACLGLSGLLQAFAHSQHHLAQLCNIVITTA